MYAWRLEIEWCTNRAHTAVNSVVFHFLYDAGGYYILDHKDKDCGARGNYWLNCLDEWVFRIGIPPLVNDWRRPNVRFNLGAHGEITGSVFWDN
jgi:hypothetical protein